MNIFILDTNIKKCAEYHCDKHVVKMILETAQLLCSVHWMTGSSAQYKLTHKNHPCSIWARQCIENYNWLVDLGLALCSEYTYRYGKIHKCQSVLEWARDNQPNIPINGDITPFALAMPNNYKVADAVQSYRTYYINDKKDIVSWKKREVPSWFQTLTN